jgi:MFS family permease
MDLDVKKLRLFDHLKLNIFWSGLNLVSGTITPLILPYLIALISTESSKNSDLALVRVIGLAVAMTAQPIAGALSDRSTYRWGRRRPFMVGGAIFSALFLLIIVSSTTLIEISTSGSWKISPAYAVIVIGVILLQISNNTSQGALQGVIPDLVPENQRGIASGVKAVMELLPIVIVILIGPLIDAGRLWDVIGIVIAGLLLTMLVNVLGIREEALETKPENGMRKRVLRLLGLTAIFLVASQSALWLVRSTSQSLISWDGPIGLQIGFIASVGLIGMAGSILLGVYFGAWVGIGRQAYQQKPFIWWVINRILFLAAVGSVQGFALFYLTDVIKVTNPATMTSKLLAVVAVFLIPAALVGGRLTDRWGQKKLLAFASLVAAAGTAILLFARDMNLVLVSGAFIGLGTGVFYATNWALGTRLAPREEAGRYLGISNLAGAGAGIVGAGIGGPMADFLNQIRPGLGYLVIFALFTILLLFSAAALGKIHIENV